MSLHVGPITCQRGTRYFHIWDMLSFLKKAELQREGERHRVKEISDIHSLSIQRAATAGPVPGLSQETVFFWVSGENGGDQAFGTSSVFPGLLAQIWIRSSGAPRS